MSIFCPNFRTKPNDRRNRTSFTPSPSKEKPSSSSSLPLGEREPEDPANSTAQIFLKGHFEDCPETGGTWTSSGAHGVESARALTRRAGALRRKFDRNPEQPHDPHSTGSLVEADMWVRNCLHARGPRYDRYSMMTRRLFRTKQAAAYPTVPEEQTN